MSGNFEIFGKGNLEVDIISIGNGLDESSVLWKMCHRKAF